MRGLRRSLAPCTCSAAASSASMTTSSDSIPRSGSVTNAGTLPRAASDVAVAELNGTAYVVGGFDGTNSLDTIVAWTPGARLAVVAHLPVALRYAAVASAAWRAAGHRRLDAERFQRHHLSLRSRRAGLSVRSAGCRIRSRTRAPLRSARRCTSSAAAATASTRAAPPCRRSIPLTGRVRSAGRLPQPISDAGVVSLGDGNRGSGWKDDRRRRVGHRRARPRRLISARDRGAETRGRSRRRRRAAKM